MSLSYSVRTAAVPHTSVLLSSQLMFNIGFYAVIPFLAVVMRDDFLLGGAAIGLVLGVRTFSQQGLFLIGGMLVDRYGARLLIAAGCAVRVSGYILLATADGFAGFLIGAALTGMGGALLSPALETLVAAADARTRDTRPANRPSLFAALVLVGEVGAAVGPLVGALLWGLGFTATVLAGAAVFAVVGIVLWMLVPAPSAHHTAEPAQPYTASPRRGSLRNPRFIGFALFFSVNLLAYNQLYLGLTFEIGRVDAGTGTLGVLFVAVSLLTITLQWPVAALARRLGPGRALPLGFALMACGFGAVAVAPHVSALDSAPDTLPAFVLVIALALGHMIVVPVAFDLVPLFAGRDQLGSYYGLLASCGGVAVLLGSVVLGGLFDTAPTPAWALLAAVAVLAATALPRLLPAPLMPTPSHPH